VILPVPLAFILVYVNRDCYRPNFILLAILGVELLFLKAIEGGKLSSYKYFGLFANFVLFSTTFLYSTDFNPLGVQYCSNELSSGFRFFGAAFISVFSLSTSVYFSVLETTQSKISKLIRSRQLLNKQIADSQVILNQNAEEFVHIFHGEVQGCLSGLSMALQMMRSRDIDSNNHVSEAELITLMEERLVYIERKIEELLESRVSTKLPFDEAIKEFAWNWRGFLKIDLEISQGANQMLVTNSFFSYFVLEILNEIATNSVRHGEARHLQGTVDLEAGQSNGSLLMIDFHDDGKGVEATAISPMGLISARVIRFGGQIEIKPDPRGGARTLISLPIHA
jgi:two-component sensor histidine kinase